MLYYDQDAAGKRIKKERIAANLTQAELAEEMHISDDMLSKIERGLRMCTPDNLLYLCQRFQKSADFFYYGEQIREDGEEKSIKEKKGEIDYMMQRLTPKELDKAYKIMKILIPA